MTLKTHLLVLIVLAAVACQAREADVEVPQTASAVAETDPRMLVGVNESYPEQAPLSTVPPTVLEKLPRLPEPLAFRFTNNYLILLDSHARLILDYMRDIT